MQILQNAGVPTDGLQLVITQANNAKQIEDQLQTSINALGQVTNMGLVDVSIAGGGAGNVASATLLAQANVAFVPLAECTAHVFEAPDRATLGQITAERLFELENTKIVAWDTAVSGDGAVFLALYISIPTGG